MIRLSQVCKRFGAVTAVDGVSLTIDPGERVALVGTNGSGKTTLLRAMAGLVRTEGTVLINGIDVAKEPEKALRCVAYVPQLAPPIDAPVGEVLRTWSALRGRPVKVVLDYAARLGLASVDGVRFRDLSGGMKQKLMAAMALASEAEVLLCDEPTANLDTVSRRAFFEAVDERRSTGVLILCSHRADDAWHLVNRVVQLSEGKVVGDAPVVEAMACRSVA
ncbi:MAG: ABC transporter ATP-binding protein [Myxococcales bacterium]